MKPSEDHTRNTLDMSYHKHKRAKALMCKLPIVDMSMNRFSPSRQGSLRGALLQRSQDSTDASVFDRHLKRTNSKGYLSSARNRAGSANSQSSYQSLSRSPSQDVID